MNRARDVRRLLRTVGAGLRPLPMSPVVLGAVALGGAIGADRAVGRRPRQWVHSAMRITRGVGVGDPDRQRRRVDPRSAIAARRLDRDSVAWAFAVTRRARRVHHVLRARGGDERPRRRRPAATRRSATARSPSRRASPRPRSPSGVPAGPPSRRLGTPRRDHAGALRRRRRVGRGRRHLVGPGRLFVGGAAVGQHDRRRSARRGDRRDTVHGRHDRARRRRSAGP